MKTYKIELWKNGQRHGHGYFDASAGKSPAFNLRDCTQHVSEEERQAIEPALAQESPPAEGRVVVTAYDWKLEPVASSTARNSLMRGIPQGTSVNFAVE